VIDDEPATVRIEDDGSFELTWPGRSWDAPGYQLEIHASPLAIEGGPWLDVPATADRPPAAGYIYRLAAIRERDGAFGRVVWVHGEPWMDPRIVRDRKMTALVREALGIVERRGLESAQTVRIRAMIATAAELIAAGYREPTELMVAERLHRLDNLEPEGRHRPSRDFERDVKAAGGWEVVLARARAGHL
jgi:hypothetical protein